VLSFQLQRYLSQRPFASFTIFRMPEHISLMATSKPLSFSSAITQHFFSFPLQQYLSQGPFGVLPSTIFVTRTFCKFRNLTGQTIPSIPYILRKLGTLKESSHLSLVIDSPVTTILPYHTASTSYQLPSTFSLPCVSRPSTTVYKTPTTLHAFTFSAANIQ